MDIATLGFGIDSKPVAKATEDLDKLAESSVKVDKVTEAMAKRAGVSYEEMAKRIASARTNLDAYAKSLGSTSATTEQISKSTANVESGVSKVNNAALSGAHVLGGYSAQLATVGAQFGLVGIAAGAAGGALADYVVGLLNKIDPLDEKLEAHAKLISAIKDAYGDAISGLSAFARESAAVLDFQLRQSLDKLSKELATKAAEVQRAASVATPISVGGPEFGLGPLELVNKFKAFDDAVKGLQETIAKGSPDVRIFREEIAKLAQQSGDEKVKALADELLKLSEPAAKAAAAILEAQRAMRGMAAAASEGIGDIAKYTEALKGLAGIAPAELTDKQKALQQLNAALGASGGLEERKAAIQAYDQAVTRINQKEAKEAAESASQSAEQYRLLTQRTKDRIEELQLEAQSAGQTREAVERLRIQHDLERAAKRAGIEVTQQLREEQEKLAKAYADAAQANRVAQLRADIQFDQRTAFLPKDEVQIAQRLRDVYGNDIAKALGSSEAAQIRLNNAIRAGVDAAAEFATTLIEGLARGEKAAAVLQRALSSLGSALLRQGANSIAGNIAGGLFGAAGGAAGSAVASSSGGLFGGLLGGLGGLFGGGAAAAEGAGVFGAISGATGLAGAGGAASLAGLGALGGPIGLALAGGALLAGSTLLNSGPSASSQRRQQIIQASLQQAAEAERQRADAINKATEAVQRSTEVLTADDSLSEVAKRLKEISDAADTLRGNLQTLGQSTDNVSGLVAKATERLRESFTSDLESKLNAAQGKGYLTELRDLIKERDTLLSDAAALGVGRENIDAYFKAQAQKIVDGADLIGGGINELIAKFPELAGVISGFGGRLTQITTDIQSYLDELRGGSGSPLSPQERLASAQQAFGRQFGLAQSGDNTAISSLTQYSTRLLDAARDYFGSSSGYQDIFGQVTSQLAGLPATLAGGGVPASTFGSDALTVGGSSMAPLAASALAATQAPAAANDNAAGFATLHSDLGAIASLLQTLSDAQIETLNTQLGELKAEIVKLGSRRKLDAEDPRLKTQPWVNTSYFNGA